MKLDDMSYGNQFVDRRKNSYAVVLFVPQNLDQLCYQFREKYDPLYNLVPAHITLVFPFETSRSLDELSLTLKREIEQMSPLSVELEGIGDFYPDSPVIYWKIQNPEPLCDLYYRLYSCLELPIPYKKMIPHVTLAREISNHRVVAVKDAIVSYLPKEKFDALSVDLVTPLINNRWVSVRTFSFKQAL